MVSSRKPMYFSDHWSEDGRRERGKVKGRGEGGREERGGGGEGEYRRRRKRLTINTQRDCLSGGEYHSTDSAGVERLLNL